MAACLLAAPARLASAFLPTRLPGTSSQRVWDIVGEPTSGSVSLRLVSADGDEGYPGELTAVVTYSLSRTNELGIAFQASVAGRPTVLNLCNHAYWNLSGEARRPAGRLRRLAAGRGWSAAPVRGGCSQGPRPGRWPVFLGFANASRAGVLGGLASRRR